MIILGNSDFELHLKKNYKFDDLGRHVTRKVDVFHSKTHTIFFFISLDFNLLSPLILIFSVFMNNEE